MQVDSMLVCVLGFLKGMQRRRAEEEGSERKIGRFITEASSVHLVQILNVLN